MSFQDRLGYRSGRAFEVGVYTILRGGTIIEDGAIVVRDGGIDRDEVRTALNDSLLRVIQAAVRGSDGGGKARLTVNHDFTYPISTECVALSPGINTPAGVPPISPQLARPPLDIVDVYDRSSTTLPRLVEPYTLNQFDSVAGARWAFANDCFYFADAIGARGILTTRALRLVYVPAPEPIDLDNETPRTDIPRELHRAIELGAAEIVLQNSGGAAADKTTARYEAALAEALASFRPFTNTPRYVRNTRPIRR